MKEELGPFWQCVYLW